MERRRLEPIVRRPVGDEGDARRASEGAGGAPSAMALSGSEGPSSG